MIALLLIPFLVALAINSVDFLPTALRRLCSKAGHSLRLCGQSWDSEWAIYIFGSYLHYLWKRAETFLESGENLTRFKKKIVNNWMHTYALINMWRSKDSFVVSVPTFTFNCVLEIFFLKPRFPRAFAHWAKLGTHVVLHITRRWRSLSGSHSCSTGWRSQVSLFPRLGKIFILVTMFGKTQIFLSSFGHFFPIVPLRS